MLKSFRKRMVMIRESIVMALDNIRSNKVRSFLTLLGIMIGVMAVITLISTVSGVSGTISSSFSNMGVGTLTVSVTGSDLKTGMTPEDLQVITELENVDGVVPSISLNGRVSYGSDVQTGISVAGRNAYYFVLNEDRTTNIGFGSIRSVPRVWPSSLPSMRIRHFWTTVFSAPCVWMSIRQPSANSR